MHAKVLEPLCPSSSPVVSDRELGGRFSRSRTVVANYESSPAELVQETEYMPVMPLDMQQAF
jgi:hypothetical protein